MAESSTSVRCCVRRASSWCGSAHSEKTCVKCDADSRAAALVVVGMLCGDVR
jgi:hypothetical protein